MSLRLLTGDRCVYLVYEDVRNMRARRDAAACLQRREHGAARRVTTPVNPRTLNGSAPLGIRTDVVQPVQGDLANLDLALLDVNAHQHLGLVGLVALDGAHDGGVLVVGG